MGDLIFYSVAITVLLFLFEKVTSGIGREVVRKAVQLVRVINWSFLVIFSHFCELLLQF